MTTAEKREPYIRLGICIDCKKEPAEKGKVRCWRCNAQLAAQRRDKYHERKRKGLCVQCGEQKAAVGHVKCPACIEKARMQWRRLHNHRKQAGLCSRCGRPLIGDGFVMCGSCQIYQAEKKAIYNFEKKKEAAYAARQNCA